MKKNLSAKSQTLVIKDETEGSQIKLDVYYNDPVKDDYVSFIATNESGQEVHLNLPSAKLREIQKYLNERIKLLNERAVHEKK